MDLKVLMAKIGNNNILWSGNYLGHHSIIEDNYFIACHVVISGVTKIGSNSFIGVNSTIGHQIQIGKINFVGAQCFLNKNTEPNNVYIERNTNKIRLDVDKFL